MSKLDAQRAIREARYALNQASGPTRRETAAAEGTSRTPATRTANANPAAEPAAPKGGERCGHKSMNGRACTRDAAHSEKSHRYS